MRRSFFVCLAAWVGVLASAGGRPLASAANEQQPAPSPRTATAASVQPPARSAPDHSALLKQYCVTCHNERLKTAGLSLESVSLSNIPAGAEVWEKVVR